MSAVEQGAMDGAVAMITPDDTVNGNGKGFEAMGFVRRSADGRPVEYLIEARDRPAYETNDSNRNSPVWAL